MAQIDGTFPCEIPDYLLIQISGAEYAHTYIKKDNEPGETYFILNKNTPNVTK